MKYKYHIDTKVYKIEPHENYIQISGWCFDINAKDVSYFVKLNGELVESEIKYIKRPDVEKKFSKKYQIQPKCGFNIKSCWSKENEKLEKVELFVKSEGESHKIYTLDEK